jgi:hypothetical protein
MLERTIKGGIVSRESIEDVIKTIDISGLNQTEFVFIVGEIFREFKEWGVGSLNGSHWVY